jgi:hypothetical protein
MMVAYWSYRLSRISRYLLRPLECFRCEGRRISDTSLSQIRMSPGTWDTTSSISNMELPKKNGMSGYWWHRKPLCRYDRE